MNSSLALPMNAFSPLKILSKKSMLILVGFQLVALFVLWVFAPTFVPTPADTAHSIVSLGGDGLFGELVTSFLLNVQALAVVTVICLILAYATVLPFFQPIAKFFSLLRFLSLVGITVFFVEIFGRSPHGLKLSLLVYGVGVFFITSMIDVVKKVPKELKDLARTLGFSEWRVVWEVIIVGQVDQVFDVLRTNAAMSWALVPLVEGIMRTEGGIGTILLDQSHHFHMSAVVAVVIVITLMGALQDYGIGMTRKFLCPWADLRLER